MRNQIMPTETASFSTDDPRWQALLSRDASQDGRFFYAVKTTGVYCRPGCSSRLPKPVNVAFYDSCESAEAAGYRPCLRCKPRGAPLSVRQSELVAEACRAIEAADEAPTLDELSEQAGLSPFHFHRIFKAVTGVTPKAYADAHRARKMRAELDGASSVTDAIYGAGFNSSGRFYAASDSRLGMTPSKWRKGGAETEIRFAIGQCSLGAILVAQSGRGICAILLGDDPQTLVRDLEDRFPKATLIGGDAVFEELVAKVVGFVEAPNLGLDLPLDVRGTAFQERVWQALRDIPAGQTVSYSELAERIGEPKAVRAVAGACAANKIAVAIPCHRVVRTDGSLSGYRWGVERKATLLAREKRA
jgi:AraC family transcriptional regulator of adaptative response/methylated-DNA-[protein]-cysteine methyltransferase